MVTKSNLILGMGETREEISAAMRDLHESGCDLLTLTQYLRPSPLHHPIDRWVHPEEFVEMAAEAEEMGFAGVMAGPLCVPRTARACCGRRACVPAASRSRAAATHRELRLDAAGGRRCWLA